MSIRFKCTACQTVLKLASMIDEARKVRCTGCGIVIVVAPDEDSENGISATIPQQSAKDKERAKWETARQKKILIGILIALGIILIAGLWYAFFSGPSDRGSAYGEIKLDGQPMETGTITFLPIEGNKGQLVNVKIVKGRYEVPAAKGPGVGMNRVEIFGEVSTGQWVTDPMGGTKEKMIQVVAKKFNVDSTLKVEIRRGSNKHDFDVFR